MPIQVIDLREPEGKYAADFQGLAGIVNAIMMAKQMRRENALSNAITTGLGRGTDLSTILSQPIAPQPSGLARLIDPLNPFTPSGGVSDLERNIVGGIIRQRLNEPTGLERDYKLAQMKAWEALTGKREAETERIENPEEKPIFTKQQIQKALGDLETGEGTRQDAIYTITNALGPNWKQIAPEAEEIINRRWPEKKKFDWTGRAKTAAKTAAAAAAPGSYLAYKGYKALRGGKKVSTLPAGGESAPDERLDPYWNQLTDKQKSDIWANFRTDPNSIDWILEKIKRAGD